SHHGSNPAIGIPSWLVGYESLDAAEWNLGNQKMPPQVSITIEDGFVKTELDLVGEIEKIHYLDTEQSGEVAGVEWAIRLLGSTALAEGGNLSAEKLVDSLNRIFSFDMIHTAAAKLVAGIAYSFQGRQEQDSQFKSNLEEYLADYF